MSITATVKNYIKFGGDQESELIYATGFLSDSPALQELVILTDGDNEISVPSVDDFTVHGVVIVPPSANAEQMTLKGAVDDTGILVSASVPSILQFGAVVPTSLFIAVDAGFSGLRLIWF